MLSRALVKSRWALSLGRGMSVIVGISVAYLLFCVFLALFGSHIFDVTPYVTHLDRAAESPSKEFIFGTDSLGRDIFDRVIAGTGSALLGPFVVAFSGAIISTVVGIHAGYLGGIVDSSVSRSVDFMVALPALLVTIVVVGVLQGGYWIAVAVLCAFNVQGDIRIVRSATLYQRGLPYIEALRTLDIAPNRIMFAHIMPNILLIIVADFALDFAFALVSLAGLAFLGLGAPPGSPEWGRMLSENQPLLFSNAAAVLVPGAMIILLATSINLIGDWILDQYTHRSGGER